MQNNRSDEGNDDNKAQADYLIAIQREQATAIAQEENADVSL